MYGQSIIREEPLIVLKTTSCFLVLKFECNILQRSCGKVAPLYVTGKTLFQRLSATLWQICEKLQEGIGNPLRNLLEGD
jgi:hypothetical protein